jgi:hypothetical protein
LLYSGNSLSQREPKAHIQIDALSDQERTEATFSKINGSIIWKSAGKFVKINIKSPEAISFPVVKPFRTVIITALKHSEILSGFILAEGIAAERAAISRVKLFRSRPTRSPLVFTHFTLKLLKAFRVLTETIKVIGRSAANRALIDIYTKRFYTSNRGNRLTLCYSLKCLAANRKIFSKKFNKEAKRKTGSGCRNIKYGFPPFGLMVFVLATTTYDTKGRESSFFPKNF